MNKTKWVNWITETNDELVLKSLSNSANRIASSGESNSIENVGISPKSAYGWIMWFIVSWTLSAARAPFSDQNALRIRWTESRSSKISCLNAKTGCMWSIRPNARGLAALPMIIGGSFWPGMCCECDMLATHQTLNYWRAFFSFVFLFHGYCRCKGER